ncbi:septation protein A [Lonepinella koalarum]|uniref:Inner membrane-spanning protein YciB n=1 Tax=Lonepinella koalarum TaxID=53417 RepID=A0A4R1KYM4_9PAST|nr:septation protein A [Lonepinella koalarum]MDH2926717.1 septation protein A [Lonepinella koalarum]TCK70622.1 intracellular septation protein [Lonepinella koalarum]TFJ89997.1 septation protein A [Lonepinella koalarum]TYG33900.1 septation protein A [Lonepinella koalarum]
MKQLLEFIPLILFFAVYKLAGVREAAITLVIATILQMVILKWKYGKIEKQQIVMGCAVVVFGLLTAYFNEIKYLQWKVTIVYALFAIILLVGQFGFKIPLIQKLLGKEITLPHAVWNNLNLAWAIFFILCMLVNIYISQAFSEEVWVEFKSFGILAMTFVATIGTGLYIYRYLPKDKE